MKRVVSIILIFSLFIGVIPLTANAQTYNGECGENITWTFDSETGVLQISGTGKMPDWYSLTDSRFFPPWYGLTTQITTIIVETGITHIGENCFADCDMATTVSLPATLTSIGGHAFSGCSRLISVDIPISVEEIGDMAFNYCSRLEHVTISCTNLGANVFRCCSSLKSAGPIGSGCDYEFTWTDLIPASAFQECDGLSNVIFPAGVESIGNAAFNRCYSLTNIDIPNSVRSIGDSAFSNCTSLESITIPNRIETIGKYTFSYCENLMEIKLPDSLNKIDNRAFENCSSLISLDIPTSVKEIGKGVFSSCYNLEEVTIPDGVTVIADNLFFNCNSLREIIIPDTVSSIESFSFDNSGIETITIPRSVTCIGSYAFEHCDYLQDVYYGGTESEWLEVDSHITKNAALTKATIHFTADGTDDSENGEGKPDEDEPGSGDGNPDENNPEGGDGNPNENDPEGGEGNPDENNPGGGDGNPDEDKPGSGEGNPGENDPEGGEGNPDENNPEGGEGNPDEDDSEGGNGDLNEGNTGDNNGSSEDDVIVEPVSVCFDRIELISEDNIQVTYRVIAHVENNSKEFAITNVYATMTPGEGASLVNGDETQTLIGALFPGAGTFLAFTWEIQVDKTFYPDGGVHYCTIIAGSDQTVTTEAKASLAIEATNTQSNELDFDVDVWRFPNFSDEPCPIRDNHKAALLQGLAPSERRMIEDYLATIGDGGHCYGMAASVILNKMNAVDLSDFTGTEAVRDATLDEMTNSILCYYHVTQALRGPRACVQSYMGMSSDAERLALLASKADSVKDGACPVLLDFGSKTFLYGSWAHAVVAYALEEGSFISSSTDKTYNRRILLYDCNSDGNEDGVVEWDEDHCLLFNEGTGDWEVPAYKAMGGNSKDKDAYLKRCASTIREIDAKNYEAGLFNYAAELTSQNSTAIKLEEVQSRNSWIIFGNTGDVQGDSELVTYNGDYISDSGIQPDVHIVLPNEAGEYRISTTSGNAEELKLNVLFDDKYVAVNSSEADGMEFSYDGSIILNGNEGEFEITIADDNIPSNEFNTYTITGDTEGDITVTVTDEGVTVTGDNLEGVSIEASEGDTVDTLTIDDKMDKAELGRDESELVILRTEKHEHTLSAAVKENIRNASCEGNGSYESVVYCSVCGEEVSRKTVRVPATGHDYKNGKCTKCGDVKTSTSTHTHSAGSKWYSNDTQHWHQCSCGAELQTSKHSYSSDTDVTCNICGFIRTPNEEAEEITNSTVEETETVPTEEIVQNTELRETQPNYTEEQNETISLGDAIEEPNGRNSFSIIKMILTALVISTVIALGVCIAILIYKIKKRY